MAKSRGKKSKRSQVKRRSAARSTQAVSGAADPLTPAGVPVWHFPLKAARLAKQPPPRAKLEPLPFDAWLKILALTPIMLRSFDSTEEPTVRYVQQIADVNEQAIEEVIADFTEMHDRGDISWDSTDQIHVLGFTLAQLAHAEESGDHDPTTCIECQPDSKFPIICAADEFADALKVFTQTLVDYHNDDPDILAPALLRKITDQTAIIDQTISEFEDALQIVESNIPVAAAGSRGVVWQGPLDADELLFHAHASTADDRDYRTQRTINAELKRERDAVRFAGYDSKCGRPTQSGTPCRTRPVYIPGRGYSDGAGCHRHLSDEERTALRRAYADAMNHDCPGCEALRGKSCYTDEQDVGKLRNVNGAWPTKKTFEGTDVHTARIDLVALDSAT